jgi:microsomal dipeptidase-like Zn-dependent dipeptidase
MTGHGSVAAMVTPAERHEMVAVAAYFRAESRGFTPGGALQDWLEAERDIDLLLAGMARRGTPRRELERVGLRNALRLWR